MKHEFLKLRIHPATINVMVDKTWEFAYRVLWRKYSLSNSEVKLSKLYISFLYEDIPAHEFFREANKLHVRLCEHAAEVIGTVPPHPCIFYSKLLYSIHSDATSIG